MTDAWGLGASDADARWVGVRRHQVVLALVTMACVGGLLFAPGASVGFIGVGAGAALALVPLPSGDTMATLFATGTRFGTRSRWSTLRYSLDGDIVTLRHRSAVSTTPVVLDHVGRLDLSGRDHDVVATMKECAQTLAATSSGGHVALIIEVAESETTTYLCAKDPPSTAGWRLGSAAPMRARSSEVRVVRERWRHLATVEGYAMTVRLRGFTPWTDRSPLAPMQLAGVPLTLALHCQVVPHLRAIRMTGRAVHRYSSDATAVSALGFRRSARSDMDLARVRAREERVASGHALMQVAVYVVIEAATVSQLRSHWDVVRGVCRENGLDVATGVGRQAQWFRWAQPGGLEW